MPLNLSNLKPAKGAVKKRKTVGRGGKRGTYSGKGMKGQKARSGSSGLKAMGFRQTLQRVPKRPGFKSFYPKMAIVNLSDLEKITDTDTIDARILLKKGIIETSKNGVKVLGSGSLTKKIKVTANAFSVSAKKAIEDAGGEAIIKDKSQK